MYGLDDRIIGDLKRIFSGYEDIDSVVLYGSRAMGNFRDGSDIDITLHGKGLTLKTVYALGDAIDELYLPYKFDISIYSQIDNPGLLEHISRGPERCFMKKRPCNLQTLA
jgi:predicted nucleotidyltransferase